MNEMQAGWAKQQLMLPARYPMAGYIARKGVSQGTLDPLFVRVLVLEQGGLRVAFALTDLLLISSAWADRLRAKIAKAIEARAEDVIVAATHTHSGPLVDTTPFKLSDHVTNARTQRFMGVLENNFVQTAVTALKNLQAVKMSYSRCPIHKLATDRNDPKKNLGQPFFLVRLEASKSNAILGVLPCHPTVFGPENRSYSSDLHGEIARRYEQQFDVAFIANGATANISTRFTRKSQTRTQVSRFAALIMSQTKTSPFRACRPCKMSIASQIVQLPIRDFRRPRLNNASLTGRLADVANEAAQVAMQLSKTHEFRKEHISVAVTLMRLGPISFAALPLEMYAETGRFLWSKARTVPLCYANGYCGYVFGPEAREEDYEVISSPFAARADRLIRAAILALADKL